jgi:hypothetical protein
MLALLAIASLSVCTVEDARYRMRTAPDIVATFHDVENGRDWPSRIALDIHIGASGRDYWFLPWNGGTDGLAHLASTTDVRSASWRPPSPDDGKERPIGDIDYIGTDASYHVYEGVPVRNGVAPAHMLMPNLGDVLWHLTPPDKRDAAPKQFFDLVGCSKSK